MKKVYFTILILSIAGIIFFLSCKKEYSCEGCAEKNKPPIAVAGPDQVITLPTDSVSLDGNISSDPDGKINEWLWTKISGPASFNIIRQSDSITKIKALVVGAYQFELKVTDNGGLSAKDTVRIIVNDSSIPNRPPVANAGMDQTITLPTNTITLNGNGSTDPDNNITSYLWTKISGPSTFNIANSNVVLTQTINLVEGIYKFELKVTDAGGLFSKDTMQVIVINQPCPLPAIPTCDNSVRAQVCVQLIPVGTLSQNPPGGGSEMAVASAGNKILFAGRGCCPGFSRVDIYDLLDQNWSTAELSQARWGISAVTIGNKIFFAGGELGDGAFDFYYSTVDIYDASTNTWSVTSLSEPRSEIAAAVVGNKVFFAGGVKDLNYNASDKVDIYDTSTHMWSTALLSEPRSYISAVAVNNKTYFAGGTHRFQSTNAISNRIDIYDNATNSWSTSSLSEPKSHFAGIAVANKIYWAGGINNVSSGLALSCTVEIKDVNTGNSSIANLFQPRTMWIDGGQNAVMKDNKIIFIGNGGNATTNKFDIYDISTNSWSIGILPLNIVGASIISVNNTIYLAGGYINNVFSNQVWKLEF